MCARYYGSGHILYDDMCTFLFLEFDAARYALPRPLYNVCAAW